MLKAVRERTSRAMQAALLVGRVSVMLIPLCAFAVDIAEGADDLKLIFGVSSIALPRQSLVDISPVSSAPVNTTQIDVQIDGTAIIRPSPSVTEGYSPPCRSIGTILLTRSSPPGWEATPMLAKAKSVSTPYSGVSELLTPLGPKSRFYILASEQTRDFRGRPVSFSQSGKTMRLTYRAAEELTVGFSTTADECFFQNAEALVTRLQAFIAHKLAREN
ncbi:hypothetical protein BJ123_1593 [Rhodopseudomonas thermotolerans]|uniref:Uncharacterized protein n=2 Tax=Rhodopseudomonas TaxID=1073 RepID=A0A336JVB0_9BRAD|nr:hypothetical protein BJ125_1592 [Rhodopseudomonas pentothenatexigens]REF86813.1 hypothetical protein BJ123_1593 [Rhodopseudomonas thermotolerans]SSW93777.1 hypothetical protein SAMN05892882_1592 [Rhodopseudomonas pentothenatexigens]